MEEMCSAFCSSIVSEAAKTLSEPTIGQISYAFKYRSYIDMLKYQVKQLANKRQRVKIEVDRATRQGDEIYEDVTDWLKSVKNFIEGRAKFIINDEDEVKKPCFKGLCPNLMSRYKLSKRAAKAVKDAENLLEKSNFSNVSYYPAPKRREFSDVKDYGIFESRREIFQDVIEALKDDKLNIIGVYGMGGVGKTTLVKQVAMKLMEDKLFNKVVMAEVTQTPDYQKIQDQIAFDLGVKFELNDSILERARRLRKILNKEKRVLIILDNIWTKLELDKILVPSEDVDEKDTKNVDEKDSKDDKRRCAIILTSRDQYLLEKDMKSQKSFTIKVLPTDEALQLFQNTVGDSAKTSAVQPIADEIVKRCEGLPVALSTVASALRTKELDSWKDALNQLRSSSLGEAHGLSTAVYPSIKLSYDLLASEEAKSLFRLCGLFGEGHAIQVRSLLSYGMALGLFEDVYTLDEARSRVHRLIENLKSSCLLLDGDAKDEVKMHDVIHVVAASICREKLMFNIPNVVDVEEKMEEIVPKGPIAISLPHRDIQKLPESLQCPNLQLFLLFTKRVCSPQFSDIVFEGMEKLCSVQISDLFFEGTKELKVLSLIGIRFSSLPSSLGRLDNLKTLCLDWCQLKDIAIVGQLKRLKILSFRDSNIEMLPLQIGELTSLKLLDVSNCRSLVLIAPKVISKLSRLEELYMSNSFTRWEKVEGGSNASLVELTGLSKLATLEIHVPDIQILPQDLVSVELQRYKKCMGKVWGRWSVKSETSRLMRLQGLDNVGILSGNHGLRTLLKKTEDLYLEGPKGVENVVPQLDDGEGFPLLKHLDVVNFAELLHIVGSIHCRVFPVLESLSLFGLLNLEKICYSRLTEDQSFINLRIVSVRTCNNLKHLFSFSVAKNLLRLQQLKVSLCNNLEMIVGPDTETTKFGFKEIIAEDDPIQKVILPSLEELELERLPTIEKLWLDQFQRMSCCQNLTKVTVERCHRLKYLINLLMLSTSESFVNLEVMKITDCKMIEEIIQSQVGKEAKHCIVFRKLKDLRLDCLPSLTSFCSSSCTLEFPLLKQVLVRQCPKMKIFSQGGLLHTPVLNKVQLTEEDKDEGCWEGNLNDTIQKLYYKEVDRVRNMTKLELSNFPRLREMWHAQALPVSSFNNLVKLVMDDCTNMTSAIPSNLLRCLNKLKILEVRNCDSLEEVLHLEELNVDEHFGPLFPVLDQLELIDLPKLKRFCSLIGNVIELPELLNLNIENCPNMEIFICNSLSVLHRRANNVPREITPEENFPLADIQPLFDEKVTFPKLYKLNLSSIHKVSHLWKEISESNKISMFLNTLVISECSQLRKLVPSLLHLEYLMTLEVSKCHKLTNLLTISTTTTLVNLEIMKIADCKMIEEILQSQVGEKERVCIVFRKLRYLRLDCLPNLTSFCLGNYTLEFPSLEEIVVRQCPKMKIFSQGALYAPLLNKVQGT